MRVKYWMTPRVVTASPDEGVKGAWTLLLEQDIRHLPVLEGDRLVGIVTDRNIRQALPSRATALGVHELLALLDRVTLREIMTKEVVTVTPDQSIPEAARLLVEYRIGALPVVAEDRLVGILNETDFLKAYPASSARLGVVVEETPGSLPAVCTAIAAKGGEIISVFAARASVPGSEVPVLVIRLEAGDLDGVVQAIREAGYRVLSATW